MEHLSRLTNTLNNRNINNVAIFYINGLLFEIDDLSGEATFSIDDTMLSPKSPNGYANLFTSESMPHSRQEIST